MPCACCCIRSSPPGRCRCSTCAARWKKLSAQAPAGSPRPSRRERARRSRAHPVFAPRRRDAVFWSPPAAWLWCCFWSGSAVPALLPRVGVGLELPLRRRGLLLTGFAEQIQLGGHGLLRENPRVVMRRARRDPHPEHPGSPPPPPPVACASAARRLAITKTASGRIRARRSARQPGGEPAEHRDAGRAGAPLPLPERPVPHRQGYHFFDTVTTPQSLHQPQVLRAELYLKPLETSALFVPVLATLLGQPPPRPLALSLPSSWYYAAQWPLYLGGNDDPIARSRPGSLHYTVFLRPVPGPPGQPGWPGPAGRSHRGSRRGAREPVGQLRRADALGRQPMSAATQEAWPRLRSLAADHRWPDPAARKARALERYLQTGTAIRRSFSRCPSPNRPTRRPGGRLPV